MTVLPLVVELQAAGGSPFDLLVPMMAVLAIFYIFLIRPQQRRQKEHEEMQKTVAKGDEIVTVGGLHGVVTGAADETLTIEIGHIKGEKIRVKVDRTKVETRKKGDEQ